MGKKIIFDVAHPGQVHQFKHIYWEFEQKGWECLFVAKDKDVTIDLLNAYNLNFVILSKIGKSILNKILQVPKNDISFYKIAKDFKPDFILNRFSIHSGHVSKLLGITNIGFSDTEHASKLHMLTLPFVDVKFTGKSYYNDLKGTHFKYESNIELFYLHPDIFQQESNPYDILKIAIGTPYCIVRFVSWEAHHDVGINHMSLGDKIELVEYLSNHYQVFISSEGNLPEKLNNYRLPVNPIHMHSILKNASLYVGEGGTMASEAACLNTPVMYTNPLPLMGYLKEQAEYGLLVQSTKLEDIKKQVISIRDNGHRNYDGFMKNKINPMKLMVWFVENYPDSASIMRENPDYQYRFR